MSHCVLLLIQKKFGEYFVTFLSGIWVQFCFSFFAVPSADLSLSSSIVPQDTTATVKNRYVQVHRLSY